MPLSTGQTLSFYEILGPLGAGGMGEVYRAKDTRLEREVAIKVLPEELADDDERLRRFEREAKTLASLNHPNVAGIHGVDKVGDVCFLALELVPGEDLAVRLSRGRLPVDEALDVCRQIAEGLEAAHEAGVVHRDLKPANVRVTPEGVVKMLDFGLAKPILAKFSEEGTSTAESDSFLVTTEGMILGTPTYMSPEQARGKPVDKRTDIWAFGCVLYECLSGKRAFQGEAFGDLIVAILEHEVDLGALPASTPEHVRHLITRCLVKDPRERLRDIGEARVALDPQRGGESQAPTRSRRPALLVGAVAGLAVGIAASAFLLRGTESEPSSPSGVVSRDFRQVSDLPGPERQPSLFPDGKSLLYVYNSGDGNSDIYLQRVEGRTPINLTPDSVTDDSAPACSPDGELIAFRSERSGGGIFVMGATGESVRRVTDFGYDPAWSPDGTQLAVTTEPIIDPLDRQYASELWIVSADGGEPRRLTEGDAVGASWSPDGRRIAYWGWREPDWQRDIFTIAADGSEAAGLLVTDDSPVDWSPAWSPDGRSLYFGSNRGGTMNLWRIDVDAGTGRPTSAPFPVTIAATWSGGFSISADGSRLAYATRDEQTDVLTVDFDPKAGGIVGTPKQIFGGRGINDLDWSPEGDRLVLAQTGEPWESLAIIGADGSGYTRITDASIQHRGVAWQSVAGSERILFYSNANLMTVQSDGSRLEFVEDGVRSFGGCWSAEGRQVLTNDVDEDWEVQGFVKYEIETDGGFRRLDWEGPAVTERLLNGLEAWNSATDSAVASGTDRNPGLFLYDLESGSARKFLDAVNRFSTTDFVPDGTKLLFKQGRRVMLIDLESGDQQLVLDIEQDTAGVWGRGMSLSPDGRKLAVLARRDEGDIWVVDLQDPSTR
ncbi:MAG: serine/threonine protein kinase [Chlamydiales bacterium]|jgi:serine/threonine protein kinase